MTIIYLGSVIIVCFFLLVDSRLYFDYVQFSKYVKGNYLT